jgi:hypothetical protein
MDFFFLEGEKWTSTFRRTFTPDFTVYYHVWSHQGLLRTTLLLLQFKPLCFLIPPPSFHPARNGRDEQ